MTEFTMNRGNSPDTSVVVAHGCVFQDGRVALAWLGEHKSVAFYQSPEDFLSVHREGHPDTWVLCLKDGWPWEMQLEPFHADAFKGTPAEGQVPKDHPRLAQWVEVYHYGEPRGIGPLVTEYAQRKPGGTV